MMASPIIYLVGIICVISPLKDDIFIFYLFSRTHALPGDKFATFHRGQKVLLVIVVLLDANMLCVNGMIAELVIGSKGRL